MLSDGCTAFNDPMQDDGLNRMCRARVQYVIIEKSSGFMMMACFTHYLRFRAKAGSSFHDSYSYVKVIRPRQMFTEDMIRALSVKRVPLLQRILDAAEFISDPANDPDLDHTVDRGEVRGT